MKRYLGLVAPLALAFLVGCGGGSGTSATGRVALTVVWPEKTRLIPEATNSIKVRLVGPGSFDQHAVIPRVAGQSEATHNWRGLQPGQYTLMAEAYPNGDGTGVILAAGSAGVMVESGVNKQVVIVMNSTIYRLEVTPAQSTITVGGTVQLNAAAYDASNNVVLLTPGKLSWYVASEDDFVTVDQTGLVTGSSPGEPTVAVRDTESQHSAAANVTVRTAGETRFYMTSLTEDSQGWVLYTPDPFTQAVHPWHFGAEMLAVAVDQQGRIYVADRYNSRIIRMADAYGSFSMEFGEPGTGTGQFSSPTDVYIDAQGRILVADKGNGRIVRFDDMSGAGWVEYGAFEGPVSVCTDPQGRILVADAYVDRLSRIDDMQGTNHVVEAGMADLQYVRVSRTGRIYTLHTGETSSLQRRDNVPASTPESRDVVSGRRIAIDSQERIYLTRQDGRLERFDGANWNISSEVLVWDPSEPLWGIAIYEPPAP